MHNAYVHSCSYARRMITTALLNIYVLGRLQKQERDNDKSTISYITILWAKVHITIRLDYYYTLNRIDVFTSSSASMS